MSKVFCIGLNKTATTSLNESWSLLGFKNKIYYCKKDPQENEMIRSVFTKDYNLLFDRVNRHSFFKDRPFNVHNTYKVLDQFFPNSKFILTVRDENEWWKSVDRWLNNIIEDCHSTEEKRLKKIELYKQHFKTSELSKESFVSYYNKYNQDVRDYFKNKDNFLEMNIPLGDGWDKLCPFLGVVKPNIPFPKVNVNYTPDSV